MMCNIRTARINEIQGNGGIYDNIIAVLQPPLGVAAKPPGLLAPRSRGRTARSEGINMIDHTTRAFDADLHSLALKIAEMSRLDETQIRQSIEALVKRDVELARAVIAASG